MLPFSLFSRDVIKYGFLCEEESDTKCIVLRGGGQTRSSILFFISADISSDNITDNSLKPA